MTRKGKVLTAIFLTLTALPIGLELIYAFDGHGDSWPWTELIVQYVPWEVALAIYGALLLWVFPHFYVRYRRRQRALEQFKEDFKKAQTERSATILSTDEYMREYGYHSLLYCKDRTNCPLHKEFMP